MNLISNDWSPLFIDFWGQLVGGIGGVVAARFVCDKILLPYSRHVIFFLLILVSALTFYYQWNHAASRLQLFDYAGNLIASIWTAYYLFWLNKELK